jgi:hypothetical protein
MYQDFQQHLQKTLNEIREAGLYKNERVIITPQSSGIAVEGGQKVINFCANNYLGLADNPELIQAAKDVPQMLGGHKEAAKEERVTIDFAFATVVTIKPVKAGEPFTKENLWVKRPGKGGILAEEYEGILGKTAARDIENDTQLTWDMIAPMGTDPNGTIP